jgi:hypothetical protein
MHRIPLAVALLLLALPAAAQQVQQAPTRQPDAEPAPAPAMQPSRGKNSFTASQARSWMEKRGYSDVGSLQKDRDDVWHARAKKDGHDVTVALDWKGNVIEGR